MKMTSTDALIFIPFLKTLAQFQGVLAPELLAKVQEAAKLLVTQPREAAQIFQQVGQSDDLKELFDQNFQELFTKYSDQRLKATRDQSEVNPDSLSFLQENLLLPPMSKFTEILSTDNPGERIRSDADNAGNLPPEQRDSYDNFICALNQHG